MKVQRMVGRFALALGLAAAAPTPACAQEVHEVLVLDFEFIPFDITIRPGDTIMFVWVEDFHTVTSNDGLFDSGYQDAGFIFFVDFPVAGEYCYYCEPHEFLDMLGIVRVEKAGGFPKGRPVGPPSPIRP